MGLKLSLIMFVLMCAMGGGAYWYYNDTQERMAILVANEAKATFAAKEAEAAKVVLQESYKKIGFGLLFGIIGVLSGYYLAPLI